VLFADGKKSRIGLCYIGIGAKEGGVGELATLCKLLL